MVTPIVADGGSVRLKSKMRILHIVSGMQKASGVTVFVENLARELRAYGHDVAVMTRDRPCELDGFKLVHVHGLWDPFLHAAAKKSRKLGIPIVWSPHGMLQKWALKNKWWKKFAALALYQWRDLHSAALLHATAQSEVEDIRRIGLRNKIVTAPLGVRISDGDIGLGRRSRSTADVKTLLFVSRVQRKKGLPNLIEAWSRLPEDLRKDWQIRIVGPDQDGHVSELKAQCDRLGIGWYDCQMQSNNRTIEQSNIIFVGPKYDSDLAAEYANADLFVLPTHSENFGSVVIEALAHGVPVITTKEAPWSELEEFKCGWWIDDNVDALTDSLRAAIKQSEQSNNRTILQEMGHRGHQLVLNRYAWSAVCDKMVRGYEEVLNDGT